MSEDEAKTAVDESPAAPEATEPAADSKPEQQIESTPKPKSKKKLGIIVGIIAVVVICAACAFAYYSKLSSQAAEIAACTGSTVSEIKQATTDRGFSLTLAPSDEQLFASMGNEDMWTVTDVKSDIWGKKSTATIAPSPSATADAFLKAVKARNGDAISLVYEGGSYDLTQKTLSGDESGSDITAANETQQVFEESVFPKMLDFDYEIVDEAIDGESATVTVKITTYNFGSAFTSSFSKYVSQALPLAFSGATQEQMAALLNGILKTEFDGLSSKDYSKQTTLSLYRDGTAWRVNAIDADSDFTNAMTGGLIEAAKTLGAAY